MTWKDMLPIAALIVGVVVALTLLTSAILFIAYHQADIGEFGRIDGAEDSERRAREATLRREERDRESRAKGLDWKYAQHPLFGDSRELLLLYRDFDTVEARLAAQFEKRADPYEGHLYSRYLSMVSDLSDEDDPEHFLTVMNEWVRLRPDSYRARLARGKFLTDYAWYFRGVGYADTVSQDSWIQFRRLLDQARDDLEAAWAMNPEDPNIPASLITVAKGLNLGSRSIEHYYRQALMIEPGHLIAYHRKMLAVLPKWGGSWVEVDAVLEECDAASDAFPLLRIVARYAEQEMEERSAVHATALQSAEKQRDWAAPYLAQLERNPEDPILMANAAYFACLGGDYALAHEFYEALGDRFYGGTQYEDVLEYDEFRAMARARAGRSAGAR